MVWTKQRMSIAGQIMIIQVWTPNFKPAEETPIVPIWISLPKLPWHCYNKEFVSSLLSPIGKVLYLDSASIKKTRGSQVRVKVQVDLTQKRPPYIWMGYIGEDITDGRWQKIEYDNISDYSFYCKHQGHLETDCTIRQRDEDKKKKEMENVRNKNNRDAGKYSQQPKGHTEEEQQETNNQQNKQQRDPEQTQLQQEEHWQTQRRKNTNQMQVPRGTTSHADQTTKQAGNITIPTQNTYINLDVQETPQGLEVRDKHKGNSSARIPQTSVQKQPDQGDQIRITATNMGKDNSNKQVQVDNIPISSTRNNKRKEVFKGPAVTGIDSMLPSPQPLDNVVNIITVEAVGGLDGKGQETLINLQEGVAKGGVGELANVEMEVEHNRDCRAPDTPTTDQHKSGTPQFIDIGQSQSRFNKKSGDRLSKKKREAIKKRLQQSAGIDSDGTGTGKQSKAQVSHKDQNLLDSSQHVDEQDPNLINKGKLTTDDYGAINSDDEMDPNN
ncbi:hypothetical protein KY284_023810 [Solanum tuberosum]|nr:hypothetical protein KY284_023810 [Solanum tuberosum]